MEGLRNQSLRHWVRVSSVTTFRVITKQGGDGGIHHHMCTQGRYLRSPTSPVLAVHCRHSIKRKHATSQHLNSYQRRPTITISYRRDHQYIYSHPPRAHTTKTSKPVTDYTSCIDQRWLLWLKGEISSVKCCRRCERTSLGTFNVGVAAWATVNFLGCSSRLITCDDLWNCNHCWTLTADVYCD